MIIGHLTDKGSQGVGGYRDARLHSYSKEHGIQGWKVPVDCDLSITNRFVCKVQTFNAGGYECVVRKVELSDVFASASRPRQSGKRVETAERSVNDIESSKARAKRKLRYLVKSMGADRLLTLTVRETEQTGYLTLDQIRDSWDRFNRLLKKAGTPIEYVAVPEKHAKGNFHIHAAICGYANVNLLRKCWVAALRPLSRSGNIDIARRSHLSPMERRSRLAKYVSKYLTKQADIVEFNKKRYWASRHNLPLPMRYVLSSLELKSAMQEVAGLFSIKYAEIIASPLGKSSILGLLASAYVFRLNPGFSGVSDEGFWFNYTEELAADCPF